MVGKSLILYLPFTGCTESKTTYGNKIFIFNACHLLDAQQQQQQHKVFIPNLLDAHFRKLNMKDLDDQDSHL